MLPLVPVVGTTGVAKEKVAAKIWLMASCSAASNCVCSGRSVETSAAVCWQRLEDSCVPPAAMSAAAMSKTYRVNDDILRSGESAGMVLGVAVGRFRASHPANRFAIPSVITITKLGWHCIESELTVAGVGSLVIVAGIVAIVPPVGVLPVGVERVDRRNHRWPCSIPTCRQHGSAVGRCYLNFITPKRTPSTLLIRFLTTAWQ